MPFSRVPRVPAYSQPREETDMRPRPLPLAAIAPAHRQWRLIVGPPGTGKTSRLVRLVAAARARGVPPERIALVTFTKAAAQEALSRLSGFTPDWPHMVRTIHSMAYQLCREAGEEVKLMGPAQWGAFAKEHGYRLSSVAANRDDLAGC